MDALALYRDEFTPSPSLAHPYAMVGLNVFAADTDEEARRLFTTPQQAWANRLRGLGGPYPPPIDDIESYWTPAEKAQASSMLARSVVGSAETVRAGVEAFIEETDADELMVVSAIYDHDARLRSYEILAAAVPPVGG
jgi:alkanesulfonate monooxygenase SsuD/methylene tetrahydromethanopterin reductase-like flavin-dependent oxidoreductase (luciferase family)